MRGTELPTYAIPDRLTEGLQQPTGMRTNPLQAIGVGQNSFANEVFIDELAASRGVDPVQFRLQLLDKTPLAQRARHVIEEAARMADWGEALGRGLGIAYLDYSGTQVAGVAEVSVDRATGAIKVHEFWCAIDVGVPVHPDNVIAQTESSIVYGLGLALGERITIADGRCSSRTSTTTTCTRMKTCRDPRQAGPATIRRAPGRWRRRWCPPRSRTRCSS